MNEQIVKRCAYCSVEDRPEYRLIERERLSAHKRSAYLAARGLFPVCRQCRMTVMNGKNPMQRPLISLLSEKVHEANQSKHKTAKASDVSALRKLAIETSHYEHAARLCETDLKDRMDELPLLPKHVANARALTCIKHTGILNRVNESIRQINEYLSLHIAVDLAAARREANRATRPEWIRMYVMREGLGKCRYCGSTENLTIDHSFPVFRGGSSDPKNLQLLCRKCNSAKGMVDRNIGT